MLLPGFVRDSGFVRDWIITRRSVTQWYSWQGYTIKCKPAMCNTKVQHQSHLIASHRITSHHITWHRIAWQTIAFSRVASNYIASLRIWKSVGYAQDEKADWSRPKVLWDGVLFRMHYVYVCSNIGFVLQVVVHTRCETPEG